jgi:hypothetical protein
MKCSGSRALVRQILPDDRLASRLENAIERADQFTLFGNRVAICRNVANHVASEYARLVVVFRMMRVTR